MTEQEINSAVERQLDYIQDCCVAGMFADEIMTALEAGFDVVANVPDGKMLGTDMLLSCLLYTSPSPRDRG